VAAQRFNAVMEVIRDGLTVMEAAERSGLGRDRIRHRSPLTIETLQGSGLVASGSPSGPVGSHTGNAAPYLLQGDDAMTGRPGELLLGRCDRCPPTPHQHRQGGAPAPAEVSEKTALTPVALILATRSRMSRPDSSAELSKLGMTEPMNWSW
jgi:hypothetical protein